MNFFKAYIVLEQWWYNKTLSYVQAYFNSSNEVFPCNDLARATPPVAVRPLLLRLHDYQNIQYFYFTMAPLPHKLPLWDYIQFTYNPSSTHSILSLMFFFRCKNIFVQRKRTKIFYLNIILEQIFFHVGWLPTTHKHFPNCCCPYILVYVVTSNTTSHLLSTSHLLGTRCNLLK